MGIMPILGGLLYFFPALFLGRYASRIGNLAASSRTEDLENALDAQKSFWKFMGILTSIVLVLYLLLIIVAIIGGAFAASAGRGGGRFGP
jgi:hypothetical protein